MYYILISSFLIHGYINYIRLLALYDARLQLYNCSTNKLLDSLLSMRKWLVNYMLRLPLCFGHYHQRTACNTLPCSRAWSHRIASMPFVLLMRITLKLSYTFVITFRLCLPPTRLKSSFQNVLSIVWLDKCLLVASLRFSVHI